MHVVNWAGELLAQDEGDPCDGLEEVEVGFSDSCVALGGIVRRVLIRIFHFSNLYTLPSCSAGHAISKTVF